MAFYGTGFCQSCTKVRDDTDNERGLCRSCVVYLYPDSEEAARLRPILEAERLEAVITNAISEWATIAGGPHADQDERVTLARYITDRVAPVLKEADQR